MYQSTFFELLPTELKDRGEKYLCLSIYYQFTHSDLIDNKVNKSIQEKWIFSKYYEI
jgi:hypothetical protein